MAHTEKTIVRTKREKKAKKQGNNTWTTAIFQRTKAQKEEEKGKKNVNTTSFPWNGR